MAKQLNLKDFAGGIETAEWRQLTGTSWTIEKCRGDLEAKIRNHVADVVLGGQKLPRDPITRPSPSGTMIKIRYSRAVLMSGELKTRDAKQVAEVLSNVADAVQSGQFDEQLQSAYEEGLKVLKK